MKTRLQYFYRPCYFAVVLLLAFLTPKECIAQQNEQIVYTVLSDCSDTGYDNRQTPNFLFDGDTSTKWHMNRFRSSGYKRIITFQTSVAVNVCGYKISTCDDTENINMARNPKTWKLYGRTDKPTSKENIDGWTLISEVNEDDKLTGKQFMTATYTCNTSDKYNYFRWEITDVRDRSNDCVQASEFSLLQAVPFVEWNTTTNNLTFKYGNKPADVAGEYSCFDINGQTEGHPEWSEIFKKPEVTTVVFDESFKYFYPTSCREWFSTGYYLKNIEGLEYLNTNEVTDMSQMFKACYSLPNIDLTHFNTDKVTEMDQMFYACWSLTTLDLSEFNTSSVATMYQMFMSCNSLQTVYVNCNFTTENCKDNDNQMFAQCAKLAGATECDGTSDIGTNRANYVDGYLTDIAYARWSDDGKTLTFYSNHDRQSGDFGVLHSGYPSWLEDENERYITATHVVFDESFSNARPTSCGYWFTSFQSLEGIEGIEHLNTSETTSMEGMFYGCVVKNNMNLSAHNTSKVKNMSNMFYNAQIPSVSLSGLDCSEVTDMEAMFMNASISQIDLTGLRTSKLTSMGSMFEGCQIKDNLDLSGFNTEKVTSMSSLFKNCTATNICLASFKTSNVTDMSSMFEGCSKLTSLDLTTFNTENVQNNCSMFKDCSSLTSLTFGNFYVGFSTDLSAMFQGCSALTSVDLSKFNTANVIDMQYMFDGCKSLASLDVSMFDTGNVLNMCNMFSGCSSLTELDLMNFSTSNVQTMDNMFAGNSSLVWIFADSKFSTASCIRGNGMFNGCESLLGAINYDASKTDYKYANCSTGYFADKNKGRNTYVRWNNTVLTFYYSYYKQSGDYELNTGNNDPKWLSKSDNIKKVVFDKSFKDQSPWTCRKWFYKTKINSIEGIENLDVNDTRNMTSMFEGCYELTLLDLSSFNTPNLNIMNRMFYKCLKLTTIYASDKFQIGKQAGSEVFTKCYKLKGAIDFQSSKTDMTYANYKTGYFTKIVGKNGNDIVGATGSPLTIKAPIVLDDNKDLSIIENCNASNISYSRTLTSEWGSLCLPIDIDLDHNADFTAYSLNRLSDDMVELTELSGTLAANTPVIIRRKINADNLNVSASGTITANLSSSDSPSHDLKLIGTYCKKIFTSADSDCFVLKGDKLMNPAKVLELSLAKTVGIKPYRAYMTFADSVEGSSAKAYSLCIDSETTDIDIIHDISTDNAEYYDLSGRRVGNLQKGINIVKRGGKTIKVIIR
ncbi:BspA family leucine-rich repeat surface protein [Prevotella sp.]|uniref:BspA family leucine-rich repeat surface protein n=1 Tax=Prevotella sp. TaxID=59823 RepID=UPI0027E3912F|nr:BspA family leucine-rich repeat surface protein [Prevotella sp.]